MRDKRDKYAKVCQIHNEVYGISDLAIMNTIHSEHKDYLKKNEQF